MTIATLPPSNLISVLRTFLTRLKRSRSAQTAQEIAHAEDVLNELEKVVKKTMPVV